jgi:hypothetical protein
MGINNITRWGNPDSMLDSEYGRVTYRQWCNREVERFRAAGREVAIVTNDGMIALGAEQTKKN